MVDLHPKPKYIRKYDYIKSLYSPKNLWFWPTNTLINELNKLITKKNNSFFAFDDDEEKQFFFEDGYAYDFYDESKNLNDDLSDKDAKKIEGQYIDKKSQEYILNFFKMQFAKLNIEAQNYTIVNIENKFKNCSLSEKCAKTINLLVNHSNIIVFQPVFIFDGQLIDIPDAIIKINDQLFLIETKAAKTPKKRYIIDLIYQKNVVNAVLKANRMKQVEKFFLCLIKDCPNEKMNVSFVLEEIFLKKLDNLKINDYYLTIQDVAKKNKRKQHLFNNFVNTNNDFWKQINQLKTTEKTKLINFAPCKQFKSFFEKNPFFNILQKKYYRINNSYPFLGYSGNLIRFEEAIYLYEKHKNFKCDVFENFTYFYKKKSTIKQPKKIIQNYYANMMNEKKANKTEFLITKKTINYLLAKQKKKKIYFDFETLNSCLSPIDKCYPYQQIVTQVSIIANHSQQRIENLKCKNFIIDPQKISISWFKKIIDEILENIDNPNEYSFVVYNQSFEKNRLEEMKKYINDDVYTKKIDGIIKNIFDLANCFNPQKEMTCYIWENKGFYSIKFVLDFILKHNPNYLTALKIKSYKALQIQNGSQAQNETTLRFFNLINDEEWPKMEMKLKEYCENDVWAMIILEYWLWQNQLKD